MKELIRLIQRLSVSEQKEVLKMIAYARYIASKE